MTGRAVVAVAASAGGVEAFQRLVRDLPSDLRATVLLALHLPAEGRGLLTGIARRHSAMMVRDAVDGDELRPGEIVVAQPDHHVLVVDGKVVLDRGVPETRHRHSDEEMLPPVGLAAGRLGIGVVLTATNEELRSAVEELETTNEELQSTNEELESMNEELQSTNEELQTLNDELRERTLQVREANEYLQSILEGLDQAVIVVDPEFRIQMWNTGVERLIGLRSFEAEGLRLTDLSLGLPTEQVRRALRDVILDGENVVRVEQPVTDRLGRPATRQLKVTALHRVGGAVGGAVVAVADSPA